MSTNTAIQQLSEVANRIREMREVMGWTVAEMAVKTEISEEKYIEYEQGKVDLPYTYIH